MCLFGLSICMNGCVIEKGTADVVVNEIQEQVQDVSSVVQDVVVPALSDMTENLKVGIKSTIDSIDVKTLLETQTDVEKYADSATKRFKEFIGESFSCKYIYVKIDPEKLSSILDGNIKSTTKLEAVYSTNNVNDYFHYQIQKDSTGNNIYNLFGHEFYVLKDDACYKCHKLKHSCEEVEVPIHMKDVPTLLNVVACAENYKQTAYSNFINKSAIDIEFFENNEEIYMFIYDTKGMLNYVCNMQTGDSYTFKTFYATEDIETYINKYVK